jgi:hypothetical protein
MQNQIYYALRSRSEGNYLVAHVETDTSYLLLFTEYADALSYLNTHSPEHRDRFAVDSIPNTQISSIIKRWSLEGIGLVQDPLLPTVKFLTW